MPRHCPSSTSPRPRPCGAGDSWPTGFPAPRSPSPLNIAEGRRRTRNASAGFLIVARGSLFELDALLSTSRCRQLIPAETYEPLHAETLELSAMLRAIVSSLRTPRE